MTVPFLAAILLAGCSAFGIGPVTLPSGDRVNVVQISKMYFPNSGSALTIKYETGKAQLTEKDLVPEADELFVYERKMIERFGVDNVILGAQHTTGGGFIHFSSGYNFIYMRRNGKWFGLNGDKSYRAVKGW